MNEWLDDGWKRWKRVLRARRGWRQRRRNEGQRIQRNTWMSSGQVGKLLRNTIGTELPPVNIQGGLVGGDPDYDYVETREAVQAAMTDLLDSWVPADQRTSEPRHLSTAAVEDEESLPTFVKEWMLNDIKAGGTHQEVFLTEPNCWANVCFNESMQNWIDTQVNTGVSPGYGGIPQELWIAAPEPIRARERLIMNTILQTGIVPPILNHRQMIFLPKSPQSTGIWDRQGLPPWRPITVQSSLATRLFTAISGYLERTVPNHPMQHGFQRDRNVQDAALATTLLLDRAVQRREELYLLSKDCEKCYDRIPRWVMAYIYRRIGVPAKLYDILMGFLAAGEIDVRSAFGWIPTGKREFGLGQGSVLSIRHIGLYMDLLMEQQDKGSGAVVTSHNQLPGNRTIAATVLVDDIVDVSTTREGIESRVEVSNKFTGKNATGGVFGATKSFLLHYRPGRHVHEDTVHLNDGYGIPRPVTVVSPAEGFKHLGIIQSTEDVWGKTLEPVWKQLNKDASRIIKCQLSSDQLRYIVNNVWIPRIQYRTQLNTSMKAAQYIDKLVRRVARNVLKLPYGTPREVFHDSTQGIGLISFVDACNVSRVQLALRVHNSPHIPAYHLLVEALEQYQILAGLTSHPLVLLLEPPPHLQGWIHQTIRAAARLRITASVEWTNPGECISQRPNDRPIWREVSPQTQQRILRFNVKYPSKIRFIGDITDSTGQRIEGRTELARRGNWSSRQSKEFAEFEEEIRRDCCISGNTLTTPVGRSIIDTSHLRMEAVEVAPDGFFVVSQYNIRDDGLELCGYELGQRIGDRISNNDSGYGAEIDVQWWHERRRGSDVWTIRPEGRATEYAELCVPVDVTPISALPGRNARQQVIIWNDTMARGVSGSMNRSIIQTAFNRSNRRFQEVLAAGELTPVDRTCCECRRLQGSEWCPKCATWHHANCRRCDEDIRRNERETWTHMQILTRSHETIAAGDGSVIGGGTHEASGTWGPRTLSIRQIGRMEAHWTDITSTRCECHALIAGLAASTDTGTQICDNKAAIQILQTARDIVTCKRHPHIKYRNRHRVEIRSMVALMRENGSFSAKWVQSHREHEVCTDLQLMEQRRALAQVDRDAAEGHDTVMVDSYSSLMRWDMIHLLDDTKKTVLGSAQGFLSSRAAELRKQAWLAKQRHHGPQKETACETATRTMDLLDWDDQQRRFYYVLHTNARKHLLCPHWEPYCWLCPTQKADTQSHRYGIHQAPCTSVAGYYEEYSVALEEVCMKLWLPDQECYIPGWSHEIAASSGLPTRAWWSASQSRWRPMDPRSTNITEAREERGSKTDLARGCLYSKDQKAL